MALTFATLGTPINTGTDGAAFAHAGGVTPATSSLLVAFVNAEQMASVNVTPPTVTGFGLTWTSALVDHNWGGVGGTRRSMFVFAALTGLSPSSSPFTVTFGTSHAGCEADVIVCAGADVSGTASSAIVQSPVALGSGNTASVNLAAAGAADNRPLAFFSIPANSPTPITPRANWSEVSELAHSGPVTTSESQKREDAYETAATATWTGNLVWGGIAVEVKAAAAAPPEPPAPVKAFPTAEGFGAGAEGPRGAGTTPTIYHVTSLSDADVPGTFRYACQQTGPRFVVFDVAGTSVAASEILIDDPYIYIAGQTAPHGGFCVRAAAGYKLTVLSIATQHVIIRHIRIRAGFQADQYPNPTAGSAGDNSTCVNHKHLVGGHYCQHVIWDHCSITWGTDGNMQSGHDTKDLTIQRCIISKPLMNAGHSQQPHGRPLNHQYSEDEGNPESPGNDYGEFSHIRISDHHNILSHGEERFPQISTGTGWVELTNNVIYLTRDLATQVNTAGNNVASATKARIVGNYYKRINTGTANYEINLTPDPNDRLPDCKIYVHGNLGENRPTDTEDQWLSMAPWGRSPAMGGTAGGQNPDPVTVTDRLCTTAGKPVFPEASIPITETNAAGAYTDLVTNANCGATLPMLDEVDAEIISEIATNTGASIDHPGQRETPDDISFAGGYPDLTVGGSATLWAEPANPFSYAVNGYMNVENSLNALAGDDVPTSPPASTVTITHGSINLTGASVTLTSTSGTPVEPLELAADYLTTVRVAGTANAPLVLVGTYVSPVVPIPASYDRTVSIAEEEEP